MTTMKWSRHGWLGALVVTLVSLAWFKRAGSRRLPVLVPVALPGGVVLLPQGAWVLDGGLAARWGQEASRCGAAEFTVLPTQGLLLEGLVLCGEANPWAGGSADGECPVLTVCTGRRGVQEAFCSSPDESCRQVVNAWSRPPR